MKAASAACFRTAAASALPPSRTYSRGVAKSNPRSTSQPSLTDRHLLAVSYAIAVLLTPAVRAPPFVLLVALAGEMPDFLFHHGLHQRQSRLPQQVAHALLQQADDLGQRKNHLDVGILFGGDPAELLHGSLLFDLVLSLHSDPLLFSWQKNQPSAYYWPPV